MTVQLLSDEDWTGLERVIVAIQKGQDSQTGTFIFDKPAQVQVVSLEMPDPTDRKFRYRMTRSWSSGEVEEDNWVESDVTVVVVGKVAANMLVVDVTPIGTELPQAGIRLIEVELSYIDAENQVRDEKTFVIGARNDRFRWEVPIHDLKRRAYEYRIKTHRITGGPPEISPWTTTTERILPVPIVAAASKKAASTKGPLMLSLLDPVEFENTVIFRDDADPCKFYPLPDQPVIPLDEEGDPEFLFIKYIKDVNTLDESEREAGGGLLQFRTVLGMHPDRRKKVVEALQARLEQEKAAGTKPFGHVIESTEPLLAAPLWTNGKVTMSTFKVSDTGLVRHATESVPVDLSGDLGASISLELDDIGAEIFWSAFKSQEGQIPIMITYQLTYKARVSAKMTIEAKREVIHRRIIERATPWKLMGACYVPLIHTGAFALAEIPALALRHRCHIAAMVPRREISEIIQRTIVNNEISVRIETDEAGTGFLAGS